MNERHEHFAHRVECRMVSIGDDHCDASLDLRDEVLRRPIGCVSCRPELGRDREGYHLVALRQAKVIGCAGLYRQNDGTAIIRHMAVASSAQRTGVGRTLC